MPRRRTLQGRLATWYAAVLSVVLIAFAGAIYLIIEAEEAEEPPEVAALEPPDRTGQHLLAALAIALPIAVGAAVGGGVAITRRALRGLSEIAGAAAELDGDRLSRRIEVRPGEVAEVAQLSGALNAMLDRVEASVRGVRRFTEDASHELRTPIAALMGEIEVTLRRPRDAAQLTTALEDALEELGGVSRLLDALLTLARSDAGQLRLSPVPFDPAEVARRVLAPYELIAAERAISLRLAAAGAGPALGDPLWVGRALANLVDNAIRHTPSGGVVEVALATTADHVEIAVRDSGPGIAADERERVFERFHRGAASQGDGVGLGLALAREIARASGGELVAGAATLGGAELRLTLPRGA